MIVCIFKYAATCIEKVPAPPDPPVIRMELCSCAFSLSLSARQAVQPQGCCGCSLCRQIWMRDKCFSILNCIFRKSSIWTKHVSVAKDSVADFPFIDLAVSFNNMTEASRPGRNHPFQVPWISIILFWHPLDSVHRHPLSGTGRDALFFNGVFFDALVVDFTRPIHAEREVIDVPFSIHMACCIVRHIFELCLNGFHIGRNLEGQ